MSVFPLAVRAAAMGLSLALTVVVARLLGPKAAGTFFVVMALMQAAATAGRLGTDNLALKLAAGDARSAARELRALLLVCLAAATLSAVLLAGVLALTVSPDHPEVDGAALVLLAGSTVGAAVSVLAGSTLRGLGHLPVGILAELGLAPGLACVGLLAGTAVHGRVGLGEALTVYAVANIVAGALALIACLSRVRRWRDPDIPATPTRVVLSAYRRPLLAMMETSLLFYLLTWSPVIVLGLVGAPTQAAYFNVAARVTTAITVIPALQVSTLTPAFAGYHRHGRIGDLNTLSLRSTRLALAVALPLATACVAVPQLVLRLFGVGFDDAASCLVILAIGSTLFVGVGPVNAALLTCGHEAWAAVVNTVLLVASTLLMLVVANWWGAAGVATVLMVGTLGYALAAARLLHARESIRTGYLRLPTLAPGGRASG